MDVFAPSQAQAGTNGASGLGATARPVDGGPMTSTLDGIGVGPDGLGAKAEWLEPNDVSTGAAVRTAGIATLTAALAFAGGLGLGGPWGAASGVLITGSIFNGYRAQKWWGSPDPSEKHEAVVSAVMAVLGVGVGGWMAYKAATRDKGE